MYSVIKKAKQYKTGFPRKQNKLIKYTVMTFLPLSLCGCTGYQSKMRGFVENNAKSSARSKTVSTDPDYQEYRELMEDGKLNQAGEYSFDLFKQENDSTESHEGMVHVTFADNYYLTESYYLDANLTELIKGNECYLKPGQSVYAAEPKIKNANSNLYQFAGYRIWRYEDGKRSEYYANNNSDSIFVVPGISEGTEFSIEPFGVYQNRNIGNLTAYYYDGNGEKRLFYGGWKVNGNPITDESAISATKDYTVSFEYDGNEYYFVEADPNNAEHSDRLGIVTFPVVSALAEKPEYSVGLHHYIALRIDYESKEGIISSVWNWITRSSEKTGIVSIKVNGDAIKDNSKLPKVKCGDVISMEVDPDYKVYCTQTTVSDPDQKDSTLVYTIKVPDKIGNELNIYTSKNEMLKYEKRNIENL